MTRPGHIRVLPLGILLLSSLMSTISPEVLAAPTSVVKLRRDLGREDSKVRPEVSGVLPHPVEARGGSAGAGAGGSRSEEVEVEAAIDQQTQARRREVLFNSFLVPRADKPAGSEHENHVLPQDANHVESSTSIASKELYDELFKLTESFHQMASNLEGVDQLEQEERLLRYRYFCAAHQEDIRSMHHQASRIRDKAAKAGDESLKGLASNVVHQLDQYLKAFETPAEEGKNEEVKN
ncbi:hypothetical protein EV361DRAFT_903165 [Lentinula raphanica]|nr:hypothetical protein F5880DRAFT_1544365 [Lentinula raphanica]KAJ3972861.1 hypothetical protein EV361DRAFT_903165 [Lentinula raphanica]